MSLPIPLAVCVVNPLGHSGGNQGTDRARTGHGTGVELCGQRPEFAWAAGTLSGRVPERKEPCHGGIPGMCTAGL